MIMTVDMGGTKTLCSFWESGKFLEEKKFTTTTITDFVHLLSDLAAKKDIQCLCFALAAPITNGRFKLTNADQELSLEFLKEKFSYIPHIVFLNDLEALGHSISSLNQSQLSLFRDGSARAGAKAVLSIGTGLGISAVTREGVVLPSEGGHIEFAPQDTLQMQIYEDLKQTYGHVSYERLLSGQGLVNIYHSLAKTDVIEPKQVTEKAFAGDPAAVKTMKLFSSILGTACSSFALTFLSTAGIYLGGGIMPKILPLLDKEAFETAYLKKGRLENVVAQIPIFIILDERAPSQGAAVYGQKLSSAI